MASDATEEDGLGLAIALHEDLMLAGAPTHDGGLLDGNGNPILDFNSGAAYLFKRSGDGAWTEVAKLVASDASKNARFGNSVALMDSVAVVGAFLEGGNRGSGAAYVFEQQPDGSWSETTKLSRDPYGFINQFGYSVSASDGRLLIGAPKSGTNLTGAAFIYERQADGTWAETAVLEGSDVTPGGAVGIAVSLSQGRALAGAKWDDTNARDSGSAYLFELQEDGSWIEVAKLTASDGALTDYFGTSVSVHGNRAIVGAPEVDDLGILTGSAYVFERQADGTWAEVGELNPSDRAATHLYGTSVAIKGTTALIGAPGEEPARQASDHGAAYVFELRSGSWVEVAKLKASDLTHNDQLGIAVALSGTYASVGVWQDDEAEDDAGAAYVFDITTLGQ
jgi:hypothetical protein